jgi:hypothetical protein
MLLNAAQFAPVVGWFLVLPLAGIAMIGAAAFALVGWQPKASPTYTGTAAASAD